jgi:hypothetical protein
MLIYKCDSERPETEALKFEAPTCIGRWKNPLGFVCRRVDYFGFVYIQYIPGRCQKGFGGLVSGESLAQMTWWKEYQKGCGPTVDLSEYDGTCSFYRWKDLEYKKGCGLTVDVSEYDGTCSFSLLILYPHDIVFSAITSHQKASH